MTKGSVTLRIEPSLIGRAQLKTYPEVYSKTRHQVFFILEDTAETITSQPESRDLSASEEKGCSCCGHFLLKMKNKETLLKRRAVPGKEAARSEEPLAAWQPCPQHYSWYKSLCFCCLEDSFIYFPLHLENRSLLFSYLYQTSGSRDNVSSPVLHSTASIQRELHL